MDTIKILYIDPGTGGMLLTVLLGIFSVAIFSLRALFLKLRFLSVRDKEAKKNSNKIPIVIHCESKRYWNIFEPILDEFEKTKQKIVYLTGSEDDPVFSKKYEYKNWII